MKNKYSITMINNHFNRYYNFNTNKFDFDVTKNCTNKNHFCSNYIKASNIRKELNLLEQKKPYPHAKHIFLRQNNEIIK